MMSFRRSAGSGSQLARSRASAFTTTELMVTVAVLGVVAAVVVPANQVQWRRERANAAAVELTSWLEVIARSPDQTGTSCEVTITTGNNRAAGAPLATVSPANCAPESTLNLPATTLGASTYNVGVSGATLNRFLFTPRGAISTGVSGPAAATNIQIKISINGLEPVRCVQLAGPLGLLRLGSNNASGDVSVDCPANQFNRA